MEKSTPREGVTVQLVPLPVEFHRVIVGATRTESARNRRCITRLSSLRSVYIHGRAAAPLVPRIPATGDRVLRGEPVAGGVDASGVYAHRPQHTADSGHRPRVDDVSR